MINDSKDLKELTIERKILILSFVMSGTFAAIEFIIAMISGSQSVLMDAAYDASEIIIIGLTIFLTPLFHKPVTEKKPFGFSQVETVFLVIKNFMMISVTIGLLANTLQVMLNGGNHVDSSFISKFQLIIGGFSFIILKIISKMNKKIDSPVIDLEVYGWKVDTYYSFGMAGAFFLSTFLKNTKFDWILPYFDQIIAIAIVLMMIPQAIKMLISAIKSMFLFSPGSEVIDEIKEIAQATIAPYNYTLTTCDVYKTGRILWVDIYFSIDTDNLVLKEFQAASEDLQEQLTLTFPNCYSQLVIEY